MSAPPIWNRITAECGDRIRAACSMTFVAQRRLDARQVLALPVVAAALGLRGVEQRLHLRVRPAHQHVADRLAERLDGRDRLLALLGRAGVSRRGSRRSACRASPSAATARAAPGASARRASARAGPARRASGTARAPRAPRSPARRPRRRRSPGRPGRARSRCRSRRRSCRRRRAAPRRGPAFSSLLARTSRAVGGHHVHPDDVVRRPAPAPRQVAEPAAQGESGDAGERDETEHRGEPVHLRLAIHVAEQAAGLRVGDLALRGRPTRRA